MLRSYLYVPGDDLVKLTKALARGADALIVDLEDGVAFDNKEVARSVVPGVCAVKANLDNPIANSVAPSSSQPTSANVVQSPEYTENTVSIPAAPDECVLVSIVRLPEAGTTTLYQTSFAVVAKLKFPQVGIGVLALKVAAKLVPSISLSVKTPPGVKAIAPAHSSFAGGNGAFTVRIPLTNVVPSQKFPLFGGL